MDRKLLEEVNEYVEEQAAIMEIILDLHGWSFDQLKHVRRNKAKKRGDLRKTFLENIEDSVASGLSM